MITRGSLEWLPVEESFGLYNTGANPLGGAENYHHQVDSRGIATLGLEYRTDRAKIESWNYMAEGVFGLSMLHATGQITAAKGPSILWGVQGFYESAIGNGGNDNPERAYILPDEKSDGLGLRAGLDWAHSRLTVNYLTISDRGRFLFPREWGREQFFVSLPRERFEGLGGVSVQMIQFDQSLVKDKMKLSLGLSHVNNPDQGNARLNKYGLPDYIQFSGLADYRFSGFFQGLDLQLLIVGKREAPHQEVALENVINRVNMINYSVILDYRF